MNESIPIHTIETSKVSVKSFKSADGNTYFNIKRFRRNKLGNTESLTEVWTKVEIDLLKSVLS